MNKVTFSVAMMRIVIVSGILALLPFTIQSQGASGSNTAAPSLKEMIEQSEKVLQKRDQIEKKICDCLDERRKNWRVEDTLREDSDVMKLLEELAKFQSERSTEHLLKWVDIHSTLPETLEKLPLHSGFPVARLIAGNGCYSLPALLKYIPQIQTTRQMHLVIYCLTCISVAVAGNGNLNVAKEILKQRIDSGIIKGKTLIKICNDFFDDKYHEPVIYYDTDLSKDLPEESEPVVSPDITVPPTTTAAPAATAAPEATTPPPAGGEAPGTANP